MSKTKTVKIKDVITWLDKLSDEGKNIQICWEGGGDSGWVYFQIDGEQVADNPMIDLLIDRMYDVLDYGSWAGEYSANGCAEYSSTEKAFQGTDYYSEDETMPFECQFKIEIPKILGFEELRIGIDGDYHDEFNIEAFYDIKNGFISEQHEVFTKHLESSLEKTMNDSLNTGDYESDDLRYWNTTIVVTQEDLKPHPKNPELLVFENETVEISVTSTDEKDIYLDLDWTNHEENYDENE